MAHDTSASTLPVRWHITNIHKYLRSRGYIGLGVTHHVIG